MPLSGFDTDLKVATDGQGWSCQKGVRRGQRSLHDGIELCAAAPEFRADQREDRAKPQMGV